MAAGIDLLVSKHHIKANQVKTTSITNLKSLPTNKEKKFKTIFVIKK